MALAFVVVLERDLEGIEVRSFDGRKLASERHALDAIAHEQDLRGLGEFVAFSRAEAEALAEDMKFDAPTVGGQSGRWFRPEDGLEVVQAIRDYLLENPDELSDHEEIVSQLGSMLSLLEEANRAGVRFRLSLDY